MSILLTIIHCFVGLFLIVVVLLQSGRAGGMGAGFGGSSTGVFGARGANTFLTKVTAGCAITFFLTSISLSVLSSKTGSVVADQANQEAPKPTDASLDGKAADTTKPADGTAAPADAAKPADAKPADATKPADTKPADEPKK